MYHYLNLIEYTDLRDWIVMINIGIITLRILYYTISKICQMDAYHTHGLKIELFFIYDNIIIK